jgi:hypothetical protein
MPVQRGRFRQPVRHHHANPVPLGHADARPRYLPVDRVGHHLHVGQDAPLDDRQLELEDLDSVLDARFQHLIALGVVGRGVLDIARVDRRHVPHRLGGHATGHDHPRRHDRPIHVVRAYPQVRVHRRPHQTCRQRQQREQRHRHQLRPGDVRFHLVHAAVAAGFRGRRCRRDVSRVIHLGVIHLVGGVFHRRPLRPCARHGWPYPRSRVRHSPGACAPSSTRASTPCSPATSSSGTR